MSIDTYVQLRTPMAPEEVRAALLRDPALADLGLGDLGDNLISGSGVSVIVRPWQEDDCYAIDDGFPTGTVWLKTIPLRNQAGSEAYRAEERVIAAVLRLVPGDVCVASQNAGGPALLRLGGTVYVNPDAFLQESLAENGYAPERLVVGGVPPGPIAAA